MQDGNILSAEAILRNNKSILANDTTCQPVNDNTSFPDVENTNNLKPELGDRQPLEGQSTGDHGNSSSARSVPVEAGLWPLPLAPSSVEASVVRGRAESGSSPRQTTNAGQDNKEINNTDHWTDKHGHSTQTTVQAVKPSDLEIGGPSDPDDENEITYPEGGLEANLVVLGTWMGSIAFFGFMNSLGTFQSYISTHQLKDLDTSTVGWIISIYIFLAFFTGIQAGPIFDAKGPRSLIATGSVLLVGGVFGMANSTEYWHFILSIGISAGLGTGLCFTPAYSAIAHFFNRRRGQMSGLAATGGSIGGILFPLILPRLFETVGFTWAARIAGFMFIALIVPANFLIHSRLPPKRGASVWPDFKIFGNLTFALTTAGVFFIEWGLFIPLTYISSFALATGKFTPPSADDGGGGSAGTLSFSYAVLSILNMASFFGRWLPGLIADRVGRFNTIIVACAICLVSLIVFWLPATLNPEMSTNSLTALLVLFSLVFGFGSGSGISLTPVCVGQLCGTQDYGRYYATCYTIVSFGCLTGVPIAGAILGDISNLNGYNGLLGFTAACYVGGMACFIAGRVREVGWSLTAIF